MTDKTIPLTLADLRDRRAEILHLAEKYGAYNVRVVGSVARDEAAPASDVDFLVNFPERTSMFTVVGLWQDLRDLLGCEVSVIEEEGLPDRFRENVHRDMVWL